MSDLLIRFRFRVAFVPPSSFLGDAWWKYVRPRRLTLRGLAVYRWLVWNFSIGSGT